MLETMHTAVFHLVIECDNESTLIREVMVNVGNDAHRCISPGYRM